MLRIALIGCGKIADAHASQIQRVGGCELIAVCDREELMAKQLSQRFHVPQHFSEVTAMLERARPDVVHITTPPLGHFPLARQCLERGCHVYIEKPFTVNAMEAEELIGLAERKGLKMTAGHDDQFRHAARRMRELVGAGYLGGAPVHMESYYGYEIEAGGAYAGSLLGDKDHWVRKLPGTLLHNIISHGIARVAEFLTGNSPQIIAHGFVSPALKKAGETGIIDELRVIIADEDRATAYFTFSSQIRPSLHQFRIHGTRNGLQIDQDNETLIRLRGARYKSYAEHFLSPLVLSKQYLGCSIRNVRAFLANDFHMKSGMKYLIENFYRSITNGGPLPIPYREILLTARIMDEIFEQIKIPGTPAQSTAGEAAPAGRAKIPVGNLPVA